MIPTTSTGIRPEIDFSHLMAGTPAPAPPPLKITKFGKHFRMQFHGSVLLDAICAQISSTDRNVRRTLERISKRTESIRTAAAGQKAALLTPQNTRRMNRVGDAIAKIVREDLSEDDLLEHLGAATELSRCIRDEMRGPAYRDWNLLYQSFVTLFTHCEEILPEEEHEFIVGGDPRVKARNETADRIARKFREVLER